MAIKEVRLSKGAKKDLRRAPAYIVDKLETWVDAVEREGLEEVRKIPGYHDEPLEGRRRGQRSVRLSRSWRAVYEVKAAGGVTLASVEEVSKHDY